MAKKSKTLKPGMFPLAEIHWYDTEEKGDTGWNDWEEGFKWAKTPCIKVHSIGYIVHECETHLTYVTCLLEDLSQTSTFCKIPRSFLISIRYLEAN